MCLGGSKIEQWHEIAEIGQATAIFADTKKENKKWDFLVCHEIISNNRAASMKSF